MVPYKLRRRFITILEVLIVIAILAMTGGVIAFNMRKFYLQQKTLDEMSKVANLMRSAQELMMTANLDAEISILQQEKLLGVAIIPKSVPPPPLRPMLAKSLIILNYISILSFEDAFQDTHLRPPFSLNFVSKGFSMNRGIFRMEGNGMVRSIVLKGYPSSIALTSQDPAFYPYSSELRDEIEGIARQIAVDLK